MLMTLSSEERESVAATLQVLETDPYVDFGGRNWVNSVPHQHLKARGYRNVRRLKAWNLGDLRAFYIILQDRMEVLVKEIVHRDEDTYSGEAPHVKRIIKNWRKYFGGESEQ